VQLFVFGSLVSVIAEYGIYMNTTDSMAKIYLVQILQQVLLKHRMTDDHQIMLVTQFFIETCATSGNDLLLAAHTLDALFDVYAENWYNKALAELNVVSMM
jgi:hypothetical protein